MKEKIQEFDIDIRFHFDANMVIEASNEKEALKIAQKHYLEVIKDHLKDKENLNICVRDKHVITADERVKLEQEGIIEPLKKSKSYAYVAPLPEFIPQKSQAVSVEELRRRRGNLCVKIHTWKKQGKDTSDLEAELEELKEQIKKSK